MRKTAFLFPGQGSQKVGMLEEFWQELSLQDQQSFEESFPGLSETIGSLDQVRIDAFAAPLVYTSAVLSAKALLEEGVTPDALAGFSLGEIPALWAAGMMEEEGNRRLAAVRTQAMVEAAQKSPGSMAAILGVPAAQVRDVLKQEQEVFAVNFNTPNQTVISGTPSKVREWSSYFKTQGGRVLPLPVQGAFHTPAMAEGSCAMARFLEDNPLKDPQLPLWANVTGRPYPKGAGKKELLLRQAQSPVQWVKTIESLFDQGVRTFIEVGYGNTLRNLTARILPAQPLTLLGVSDRQSAREAAAVWKGEVNNG
ncbi:Malonyl CoA-acyl carrier protein transacylase [Clostridiaceae bacterium JG1575]|nr:Malonyl CoA-acyl carrier protein transacylase [Clostridiaceae bacterium JG1575]